MGKKDKENSTSFLSKEDEELWQKITQKTKPLSEKDRNRYENVEITVAPKAVKPKKAAKTKSQTVSAQQSGNKKSIPKKSPPPLADIDRKKVRKISTDQINIQATLDLHGYRQEQAHATLRSFIRNCQSQDFRYVLIITGKGATKKPTAENHWQDREPGVLKRSVPQWLSDPDMRDYVVGYSFAHAKHGGDGALYVQLRRNRPR